MVLFTSRASVSLRRSPLTSRLLASAASASSSVSASWLTRAFASSTGRRNLIFVGAPGVGKGSIADRAGPHYGVPLISTGDMLRREIKRGSELGVRVGEMIKGGDLVDDDTITALARARLAEPDCAGGFILDGFPRTLAQADALSEFAEIDAVLQLTLPTDVLVEKACARRVCSGCGKGYNLADINRDGIVMGPLLPQVPDTCDKCGDSLVTRPDDTMETVTKRLEIYEAQTRPLNEYYDAQGKLVTFAIKRGMDDVPDILAAVDAHLDGRT